MHITSVLPRRRPSLIIAGAALVLAACRDSTGNEGGPAAALEIVSGNEQVDTLRAVLPESLVVRAVDGAGRPVAGATVAWSTLPNAGLVAPASTRTDARGLAAVAWTLGQVTGTHTATAQVAGAPNATFTATAVLGAPSSSLLWTVVHRSLPLPAGAPVGLSGGFSDDVFTVTADGRVFEYDGAGWLEFIATGVPGALGAMWGTGANFIYATGVTAGATTPLVTRFNGSQWVTLYTGAPGERLRAIHGTGPGDIWAVGTIGAHWDGASWTDAPPPSGVELSAVWTPGGGTAFAGSNDGTVYRWNGGWTSIGAPSAAEIVTLWGSGASDLWAGDAGGALHHWDGAAWGAAVQQGHGPIRGLWGAGPDDVWAAGDLFAHFDGAAWTALDSSITRADGVVGMWGAAGDDIWVATAGMRFVHYDGSAWVEHPDSYIVYDGAWGSSDADVWVCGGGGTVRHLSGTSWESFAIPGWQRCTDVDGSGADFALAPTGDALAYRLTGGVWQRTATGGPPLLDVWVASPALAFAVGPAGRVERYENGAWSPMATGGITDTLHAVWGSGPADVWAAGSAGRLLHYDGTAWQPVTAGTAATLTAIWGAAADDIWIVGELTAATAEALHFDGTAWHRVSLAGIPPLRAIHGRSAREIYAAGDGGTIIHFDGSSWFREPTGITDDLRALFASREGTVFAAGVQGIVLRGNR